MSDAVILRTFSDDLRAASYAQCVISAGGSVLGITYCNDPLGWRVFSRVPDLGTIDVVDAKFAQWKAAAVRPPVGPID